MKQAGQRRQYRRLRQQGGMIPSGFCRSKRLGPALQPYPTAPCQGGSLIL